MLVESGGLSSSIRLKDKICVISKKDINSNFNNFPKNFCNLYKKICQILQNNKLD